MTGHKNQIPAISVVMPTFNTPIPYLKEAVESILNQTFRDFEFIIIDDGSTNGSDEYLKSLEDNRVNIIWNNENLGVTKSLNIGLKIARGKYIARMDADDISLPLRFEKQYAFMEMNPNAILSGSWVETFGAQKTQYLINIKSIEHYKVKAFYSNPGPPHPSIFINNDKLKLFNITYDENLVFSQDYGLYSVLCEHGDILVIPEILLKYRIHEKQISHQYNNPQARYQLITLKKHVNKLIDNISDEELFFHYRCSTLRNLKWREFLRLLSWNLRLIKANSLKKKYNSTIFNLFTCRIVFLAIVESYLSSFWKIFYEQFVRRIKSMLS